MSNVEKFYPKDAADDPNVVLEWAHDQYADVLVMGWTEEGEMRVSSSRLFEDGGELLWLLELFKARLMAGDFGHGGVE